MFRKIPKKIKPLEGRFAWEVKDVCILTNPIPAKGRLGLWELLLVFSYSILPPITDVMGFRTVLGTIRNPLFLLRFAKKRVKKDRIKKYKHSDINESSESREP